jgi:hypothetical protein
VAAGERYWVRMAHSDGEWTPRPGIRPLLHHASRLELDNLDDFGELERWRPHELVFVIEITSIDSRQVPGLHPWRSTYHARLLAVCDAPPATDESM